MKVKLSLALLAATLAAPRNAKAQIAPIVPPGSSVATVITFQMQLNLTNLQPDLERVRLACVVQSPAYSWTPPGSALALLTTLPGAEMYATQGKAAGTLSFQFPIATAYLAADAGGKQANYTCALFGYSSSLQRWDLLNDQQAVAAFRVTPTPPPLAGTFFW